jgi:adenylate cyclase, class 2
VMIDETPIGVFVEIEGSPSEIEHTAQLLGKSTGDYRLESYPRLYADWCAARGLPFGEMSFSAQNR